jgi:RNA polymerase sigma factor (sigma-70 family)
MYRRLLGNADDLEAWLALCDRLERWANASLADFGWHAIEDVVEDACSAVILEIRNARGPETFGGFALGYFQNARRRQITQRRLHQVSLEGVDVAEDSSAPVDPYDVAALKRCLAVLLERQRRAVELRYLDGCSTREIASALVISEGNARKLVCDGLARLRRCINEHGLEKS